VATLEVNCVVGNVSLCTLSKPLLIQGQSERDGADVIPQTTTSATHALLSGCTRTFKSSPGETTGCPREVVL
jgi:hypothetical protein